MEFYNDTTKNGICQEIDFIVGSDVNEYPLTQKARNVNRWLDRVVTLILRSDGKWNWDDANYSDLPIGTLNLVANQQNYSISGNELLKLLKVECADSDGTFTPLYQIDTRENKNEAMSEIMKTAGTPQYFDLINNTFILYPKPSYSYTGGLKIYYQRIPDYFTSTDTTQVPGFAEPYHRILSYGAALDFAISKNMTGRIPMLREEIAKLEEGLIEHYSSRNLDLKNRMTLRSEDYGCEDYEGERSVDWSS